MLHRELRYAARAARKSPVFSAVAIASLAIAIGANSTVFSLLNALWLRPLPIHSPAQLVNIHSANAQGYENPFPYPAYEAFGSAQTVFSGFFACDGDGIYDVEANGTMLADAIARVSGNFYNTLGVTTLLGRPITPEDDGANGHAPQAVGVISYRLWREHYGGDPHVLGKIVRVNGKPFVIVGVNRLEFMGMEAGMTESVIIPIHGWLLEFPDANILKPKYAAYSLYGRLKPGATIAQARAQFTALWPRVRATAFGPDFNKDDGARRPIAVNSGAAGQSFLRLRYTKPLFILMAAAAVLLLIACVNLANLLLARAAARSREMAIRLSLGARASTLLRQCLVESVVLSLAGAAAGAALAIWASRAIAAFLWIGLVPLELNFNPDIRILAFTSSIGVLTGVLFGLVPATAAIRQNPAAAMQYSNRVIGGTGNTFARILIMLQVALSIALLAGAALFARSLHNLRSIAPGFQTDHLLVAQLMPRPMGHKNVDLPKYYRELLRNVRAIPGVAAASVSAWRPIEMFDWKQRVSTPGGSPVDAEHNEVAPGFFEALGIAVLEGRAVDDTDTPDRPAVTVVSASLAHRLFPSGDAVGRRLVVDPGLTEQKDVRIVGIVSDARLHNIRKNGRDALYLPLYQNKDIGWPSLDARVHGDPEQVAPLLRHAIDRLGREFALTMETVDVEMDHALIQDRLLEYLSMFVAVVALFLAAIGLYGLLSYSTSRRGPEIGIRMALGARPGQVLGMVLRGSIRLVLWGAALGLVLTLSAAKLIAVFLYDVSPYDPLAITVAVAALLMVAIAASWIPARRASRIDPVTALRTE